MKKNIAPLLFGIIFILTGFGYLASVIFGWKFTIFFDGWWTLFIIVPCLVSLFANGPRTFNAGGLLIGGLFLLRAQGLIPYRYFTVVLIAVLIILIGVACIARFIRGSGQPNEQQYYAPAGSAYGTDGASAYNSCNQTADAPNFTSDAAAAGAANFTSDTAAAGAASFAGESQTASGGAPNGTMPNYNAILGSVKETNSSSDFLGARLSSIMGNIELDLRNATLRRDVTVYASTIMGGVTILAPQNVRINVVRSDVLGTTQCTAMTMPQDAIVPIVTFSCSTIMGGIQIK